MNWTQMDTASDGCSRQKSWPGLKSDDTPAAADDTRIATSTHHVAEAANGTDRDNVDSSAAFQYRPTHPTVCRTAAYQGNTSRP